MLNKATLIGNVGRDPEIRSTNSGSRVASFSLATSERWTDKTSNEKHERTEWHNVIVWSEGLIGVIEKYVHKGMRLYVEGKIQTRKWTDKQGQDRYSTEIVLHGPDSKMHMLDRGGSGDRQAPESHDDYGTTQQRGTAAASRPGDLDDEIPF